ncbi:response regulator [Natronorubrum daqingense]|uniref:Response regulator n=1 Tax=Natronorubrum daqingense TaxID=588898 RepID=A0A1N7FLD1_9EURY|nr:response regulator [Natronorubrum daqingense]APX98370.1 response regulator [Natronorubrum daqingense]SIS01141.1 Response regulator receiver domain-containing protein [Natronorubrum daqingense]
MAPDSKSEDKRVDILLVEPNPGDTRLFTESFKDAKLKNELYTVSDGDDALDMITQRGAYAETPQPDLILLEPKLPGKNGMDVLSELNNESALEGIPVVVLTSSDMGEDIVKSHELDADHYLQKPVEPEDFIRFVQEIEDLWFEIVQDTG